MSTTTNTNNIGIGVRALDETAGSSYNVGIGTNSLTKMANGSYNTAIGAESGASDTANSNNTFLGANTDIVIGLQTPPNNSTAIGYNTKISESNQIVMGTSGEFVCIPGQLSIGKVVINIDETRKPASGVGLDVTGDIVSTGKLIVSNDISGNGSLRIANNIFSNGTLFVAGDISGNSNLKIKDISANALTLGGRLVAADIDVNKLKVIDISGTNLSLTNKLFVASDISCNGNLKVKDISGNGMKLTDKLVVEGDITTSKNISGNSLTINGLINSGAITSSGLITGVGINAGSGQITTTSKIDVSGAITAGGLITGVGINAGSGPITTTSKIDVSGAITTRSKIDASGAITSGGLITGVGIHAGNGAITGATNITADGAITGVTTISASGPITSSGLITGLGINAGGSTISNATDITANTMTLNGKLIAQDISGQGLSLTNKLSVASDICGNKLIVKDISANGMTLDSTLHIKGDISGNNLRIKDVSANVVTINKLFVGKTEITTNGSIADGSNNTILGGFGIRSSLLRSDVRNSTAVGYAAIIDLSNQIVLGTSGEFVCIPSNRGLSIGKSTGPTTSGLDISGTIFLTGDISGNNMRIKDVSANVVTINKLFVGKTEITTNGSIADGSNNTILGGFGIRSSLLSSDVRNSTAVGYAAIIDSSNQIVLGTSGEFVCIPSNTGLSVGKNSKPNTGVMLDVSGSSIVSGDLTIRGTYYGDSSSNIKIGGVTSKTTTNNEVGFTNTPYTTNPTTNAKLTIDNTGSIYLVNESGSALNYSGYYLESTADFNGDVYSSSGMSTGTWTKDGIAQPNIQTIRGGLRDIGLSTDKKFWLNTGGGSTFQFLSLSTNLISSTLYKYSSSGQTIYIYIAVGQSAPGSNLNVGGVIYQKVASMYIPPPIIPQNSTYLGANIKYSSAVNTSNSTAIGYGANIDVSNQIVLGTSGEFVCIPSNRGLSVGKNSNPASMLDVSGSSIVSGDLTLRGTFYGDSSSNIKIGGVTSKTAGEVFRNTSFTTSPTTNIKLTISGGSIYIQNLSGSVVNHGGYVLESTTGFNRYVYTAQSGISRFNKNVEPNQYIAYDSNVVNSTSPHITAGLTLDNLFYSYVSNGVSSDGAFSQQFSSSPTYLNQTGPIGSTLYKYIYGQQTITLYLRISISNLTGPTDNIDFSGYILQKVASITIEPPTIPRNSTYLGANIKYLSDVDTSTSTAIGYGANIDVSNQIVLGTSGEFVCIPSNRGLSVGKNSKPTSMLDVSGSSIITGDLTIRGSYYGDTSNNVRIGSGITSFIPTFIPNEVAFTSFTYTYNTFTNTTPTTNVKLTLDNTGSIYLVNQSGSPLYHSGYVLESTTGFNPYTYTADQGNTGNWSRSDSQLIQTPIPIQGLTSPRGRSGLSTNYKFWYNNWDLSGGTFNFQFPSQSSNLITSTLYKSNSSGQQTINIYLYMDTQYNFDTSIVTIPLGGTPFQKVASLIINQGPPPTPPQNSTYLGANIKYSSAVNTSNSTAIGYGTNIETSNQIVLGTSGEFVCIPSNTGLSIGKSTTPFATLDISGNLSVLSITGKNTISANGNATENLITALSGGLNTIRNTTGTNTMENTNRKKLLDAKGTGVNTIQSAHTSLTTANLIDATAGGGNTIKTTSGTNTIQTATGKNTLSANGTGAENLITAVTGATNTIKSTTGTNTMENTSGKNLLDAKGNGVNTIQSAHTTLATANLIDATGTGGGNTIRSIDGTNTIQATGTGPTLISNNSGQIQLNTGGNTTAGNNSILINVTNATSGGITLKTNGTNSKINIDAKTEIHQYIDSATNTTPRLSHTSVLTKITNANVDIVGNLNATFYRIGTNTSFKPLVSCFWFATNGSLSSAGTASNLTLCGATPAGTLISQMIFPFDVKIEYITGHSSAQASTTAQTLGLYFLRNNPTATIIYTSPSFTSPTAATAQSITIASPANGFPANGLIISANTPFYGTIAPTQASSTSKSWMICVYYSQR